MQRALTRGAKLAAGFRAQCQASTPVAFARLFASDADLKKTPLYDFHVENGGTQDIVEAMGRVHQAGLHGFWQQPKVFCLSGRRRWRLWGKAD